VVQHRQKLPVPRSIVEKAFDRPFGIPTLPTLKSHWIFPPAMKVKKSFAGMLSKTLWQTMSF
jgi:hypothetical protein